MEEIRIPVTPGLRRILDAQHRTQIGISGAPLMDRSQVLLFIVLGVGVAAQVDEMEINNSMLEAFAGEVSDMLSGEIPPYRATKN